MPKQLDSLRTGSVSEAPSTVESLGQVHFAEEYALRRFDALSESERPAYPTNPHDALAMLVDEYYEMIDTESGYIEQENAEIELHLMRERGEKLH